MSILGGSCSTCCGGCLKEDPAGTQPVSGMTWWAQSFTTPPAGLTLYSASLYLQSTSISNSDYWSLDLYTDNGAGDPANSHPNALEESLTSNNETINASGVTVVTYESAGTPLTGSTRYWLVFHENGGDQVLWQYMSYLTEACGQSPSVLSENSGSTWGTAELTFPFKFYLN